MRIVDPACGSGAFLISAFRQLLAERIAAERDARAARGSTALAVDETPLIAEILRDNIYGVDINPASVEIAKLALWLHTARASAPLVLVGSHDPNRQQPGLARISGPDGNENPEAEERVRSFDWRAAFPRVWPNDREGGFDIVLGNPPYVKLQNLMKVDPDVVAYLHGAHVVPTPMRAPRPAISISICRSSKRACDCSPGRAHGIYCAKSMDREPVWRRIARSCATRPASRPLARFQGAPDFRGCYHLYGAAVLYARAARRLAHRGGAERRHGRYRLVRRRLAVPYDGSSGRRRMADGHRRGAGADRAARTRMSAARRSVADDGNFPGSDHERGPHLSPSSGSEQTVTYARRKARARSHTRSKSRTRS